MQMLSPDILKEVRPFKAQKTIKKQHLFTPLKNPFKAYAPCLVDGRKDAKKAAMLQEIMQRKIQEDEDTIFYNRARNQALDDEGRFAAAFKISNTEKQNEALNSILNEIDLDNPENDALIDYDFSFFCNKHYETVLNLKNDPIRNKILTMVAMAVSGTPVQYCLDCANALENNKVKQEAYYRIAMDDTDRDIDVCFKAAELIADDEKQQEAYCRIAMNDPENNPFYIDIHLKAAELLIDHQQRQEAYCRIAQYYPEWLCEDREEPDIFSIFNNSCFEAAQRIENPTLQQEAYQHIAGLYNYYKEQYRNETIYCQPAWVEAAKCITDPVKQKEALKILSDCEHGYGLWDDLQSINFFSKQDSDLQKKFKEILTRNLLYPLENNCFFIIEDLIAQLFAYENLLDKPPFEDVFGEINGVLTKKGINISKISLNSIALPENNELSYICIVNILINFFCIVQNINSQLIIQLKSYETALTYFLGLIKTLNTRLGVEFQVNDNLEPDLHTKTTLIFLDHTRNTEKILGYLETIIHKMDGTVYKSKNFHPHLIDSIEGNKAAIEIRCKIIAYLKNDAMLNHIKENHEEAREAIRIMENYYKNRGILDGIINFIKENTLFVKKILVDIYLKFKNRNFLEEEEIQEILNNKTLVKKKRQQLLYIAKNIKITALKKQLTLSSEFRSETENRFKTFCEQDNFQFACIPQFIITNKYLELYIELIINKEYLEQLKTIIKDEDRIRFARTKVTAEFDKRY